MADDPAIWIRDLTKFYGEAVGVDGVDLSVQRGEVFGFLGPNGSGKTTTIRLLLDLIRPDRGDARILGAAVGDPRSRRRVGYLPGELALDERMTGRGLLDFLGGLTDRAPTRRDDVCCRLDLSGAQLDRPIRECSRGMKQKIGIVAALQHEPDVWVLDEPTTGLDPLVRDAVIELMAEAGRSGRTVFHSSHVLSEVERSCTRIGVIRRGRLIRVMRTDDIRRSSSRRMELRFAGAAPVDELALPGVEILERHGSGVVLRVGGELDPLLRVLARHSVLHLAFPEPTLEEAFEEVYRAEEPSP